MSAAHYHRGATNTVASETLSTAQGIAVVLGMLLAGLVVGSGCALFVKQKNAKKR